MNARVVGFCILLCVSLLFPAIVKAEEASPSSAKPQEAPEAPAPQLSVDEVARRLEEVQKQLQALAEAVKALQQSTPAPQTDQVPVDRVTREEFNGLAQIVDEQMRALGDIATRVGQPGTDKYVVNLRGLMQVPEFRDELAGAVHNAIRRRGMLRVENKSAVEHRLLVNGTAYRVPALRTVEVDVPAGTLTTELVGYEPPKNWNVGPPNYRQAITITPTGATPVYVGRPAIVDTPVFYSPPVILF